MSLLDVVNEKKYKSYIPFLSLFLGVSLLAVFSVLSDTSARPVSVMNQFSGVYTHGYTHALSNVDILPLVFEGLPQKSKVLWCELIPIIDLGDYQSYTANSRSDLNCFKAIRVSYDTKHIFDHFPLIAKNNLIEI